MAQSKKAVKKAAPKRVVKKAPAKKVTRKPREAVKYTTDSGKFLEAKLVINHGNEQTSEIPVTMQQLATFAAEKTREVKAKLSSQDTEEKVFGESFPVGKISTDQTPVRGRTFEQMQHVYNFINALTNKNNRLQQAIAPIANRDFEMVDELSNMDHHSLTSNFTMALDKLNELNDQFESAIGFINDAL